MDQTQNDSFGSLLNGQGGNMQTGGNVGGFNNAGMGGQQTLSPMPVSTGGPIVLNNGGEKKSKKWVWMFSGFLILIIIIVIFIVARLLLRNSAFNDYRELVLYNSMESSYPTVNGLYAVQKVDYFDKQQEINDYYERVRSFGDKLKNNIGLIGRDVIQYIDYVSIWTYVSMFYNYYDEQIVSLFESDGYEKSLDYIKKRFSQFIDSKYEDVSKMGGKMVEMYVAYLEYIEAFESNGCKISELTDECDNRENEIGEGYINIVDDLSLGLYNDSWILLGNSIEYFIKKDSL